VGFNIGTSMEHHRCFNVYIVKTRATRVSDSIFFKHQYITNPQVTPETLVLKAAVELTSALKGTVSREKETAGALAKISELFLKIAEAKAAKTVARNERDTNRTHPTARRAVPPPRVEQPTAPPPRVQVPTVDDCCVVGGRRQIVRHPNTLQIVTPSTELQIVNTPGQIERETSHQEKHGPPSTRPSTMQIVNTPTQIESVTPHRGKHGPPSARPNYICKHTVFLSMGYGILRILNPSQQESLKSLNFRCNFAPSYFLCIQQADRACGSSSQGQTDSAF
jgi:hypothetical protein